MNQTNFDNWQLIIDNFIDTGSNAGEFNMSFDLQLAERCRSENKSFLRFYRWQPYCISLGYNQTRERSPLNYSKCEQDGIDVVTRPTGGRAVLHAEELTYSVVMKTGKPPGEVYSEISEALLSGLRQIDNSNPGLQKISAESRTLNPGKSAVCFASPVKDEINFCGKKFVGSAQRNFGDVILQHGSVLIGEYHKNILKYLNITAESLNGNVSCLNEILEREVSYDEVKTALLKGFNV